jgi:predicted metal-dependent hydrolase
MQIPYKVEHRKVKYPRLEFKGLQLLVILPPEMKEPSKIIEKRKTWIQRKWNLIQEAVKRAGTPRDFMIFGETYTIENTTTERPTINHKEKKIHLNYENNNHPRIILNQLKKLLKVRVKPIVEEYASKFGFKPNKILIKRQQTKWGSCSGRKNITLNLKLVCLPEQTIRYIIFHELTHLKHKRHNQAFWQTISQEFPNYKKQEQKLLEYWFTTELLFQNLIK